MTAKKLLRVLAGEAVWPPPVWLMRQAGRYLPEYRALREESGGFIARCTNPDLATEITLQPIRRYGMDAAILFSDILMLPWAMGHGLDFVEGEGPVLPKLRDAAALNRLSLDRVPEMTAPIIETVRRVRATLPESCALIGFAGSPFTVACYMVEGGGSRDFAATRLLSYAEPVLFDRLIDLLVEATIGYLSAQVAAGAETVMLFDTWAGLLPPAEFVRHVVEPTKRIVAAIKRLHPGLPVIGFPRLAGTQLGAYAGQTGVDAVGLDTAADPVVAASLVPEHVALQGNLDPLAVVAGGEALEQQATAIATAFRGRPHIFNLGHGILPQTPTENVAALIERLRSLP
ncbi:MAG TPA: uroporphyrinogen decarboxylase [Acetobacteraceae bacterium]|nr:uroporphyrinogen decarboxylase [Acetobacteraceae bacterium]